VAAHLVTLYVSAYDAANGPQWQQQYSIDIWIGAGTVKYNFGQNSFTYTPITPGYINQPASTVALNDASSTYVIKLVTERGNIATYIVPPPGQGGTQYPGVPIIPGTMRINYEDINNEQKWIRPYIEYLALDTQVRLSSSYGLYVRAIFVNPSNQPITIERGSILFQIASAPANKKIFGFGGRIFSGPTTWNPGQEITVIFKCKSCTWSSANELDALFEGIDPRYNQVPWTGTAAFTSMYPSSVFYSAAAVVDGLLVYRTP